MKRRTACGLELARFFLVAYALAAWPPQLTASGQRAIVLGQISLKGEATINGVNAIGGASMFSGDHVTTQKGATASVSMKSGDELILGELTSVEIVDAGNEIRVLLDGGQLEYLSGPELPIVVRATSGAQIVPQGRGGVYAVALQGDTLRVTARKGSAKLKSTNGDVEIAEGKTLVAKIGTLSLGVQKPPNGSESKGSSGHIVNYVIVAAGVAGGAGLALALVHANSGCAVSPSNVGDCTSPH